MPALALLLACLILGFAVARLAQPPSGLSTGLNWWVLYVALPATVLRLAPTLAVHVDFWYLAVSMWLIFLLAWALFALIGRARGWSNKRIGALTLVCGLGNTSFIGYPMIEALRGSEALSLAVVADQAGCFVALAVGGAIITALYGTGGSVGFAHILRRVLLFPAFLALLIGGAVGVAGGWPQFAATILERIGSTLVPLALFAVGLQIRLEFPAKDLGAIAIGLLYKLALAPLIVFSIGHALGLQGAILMAATLQAAMAPMISAAILAEQHELDPHLANKILTIGILLSFVSVPLIDGRL